MSRQGRLLIVVPVLLALVLSACTSKSSSNSASSKPVNLAVWVTWSEGSNELTRFNELLRTFESQHKNIKVTATPDIGDQTKLVAAIAAGNGPDVSVNYDLGDLGKFCSDGALTDLGPEVKKDGIKASTFAPPAQRVFTYNGKHCAIPYLADATALYYNKALLTQAGYSGPPKTVSELTAMAKKLTQRNADGSIKVAGMVPLINFYENYIVNLAPPFDVKWFDGGGKSIIASDPGWNSLFKWQKGLVDDLGYNALTKFKTTVGDEFSPDNGFETGKIALQLDGEWRTAAIAKEHPELNYATAPFPVPDDHPELYGAGAVSPNIIAIPKGAKHRAEAWELIKFLALDTRNLATFASAIHNIPTTTAALKSSDFKSDDKFQTFLDMFGNAKSSYAPSIPQGAVFYDPVSNFAQSWEAGKVANLATGLASLDAQVDAVVSKAS